MASKRKRRPSGVVLQRMAAKLAEPGALEARLRELVILMRYQPGELERKAASVEKQILIELIRLHRDAAETDQTADLISLLRENKELLTEARSGSAQRASVAPTLSYKPDAEATTH